MKYSVEMRSSAMVYRPSFIKLGSGIWKVIEVDTKAQKRIKKQGKWVENIKIFQ
jgi:hypothetical protein